MIAAAFDYIAPPSLDEALRVLAAHGEEAKLLAGGHSLLPLLKLRLANPKLVIDLSRIPRLSNIGQEGDKVVIGALATHYQIESSKLLETKCPLLPQTARAIGDVQAAIDTVQAGVGDLVYLVGSREAALACDPWFVPVDAAIVGIVDGMDTPAPGRRSRKG